MNKISSQEAIQFLDQANFIYVNPENSREMDSKKYIAKYAIRNIVYGLSKLNIYELLVFLETILLCRDDTYKTHFIDILKGHPLKNVQNLVFEHLIYADQVKLEKALSELTKAQVLNMLFFLSRFAIIDTQLYLHKLLLSSLNDKISIMRPIDFIKIFNIHLSFKLIYSKALVYETENSREGIPTKEISLLELERKISDLVYYCYKVQRPVFEEAMAIHLLSSAYLEDSQRSLIPKEIRQSILEGIDLEKVSVKDLIQSRYSLSEEVGMEKYTQDIMQRILTHDKRALIELDFQNLATLIRMVAKYDSEKVNLLYNY